MESRSNGVALSNSGTSSAWDQLLAKLENADSVNLQNSETSELLQQLNVEMEMMHEKMQALQGTLGNVQQKQDNIESVAFGVTIVSGALMATPLLQGVGNLMQAAYQLRIDQVLALHPDWTVAQAEAYLALLTSYGYGYGYNHFGFHSSPFH